jgi:2-methylcitrate dehydratase PrpD
MGEITERLARWSAAFRFADVPDEAVGVARKLLLDYLGNAIGGARDESTAAMARFADAHAPRGPATAIARRDGFDAAYAALQNGQAAHVLESDDTHQASSSHPGASVWSAVLALGESVDASFAETIAAAVVGYEVVGRLGMALGPAEHYARGFHPTGTCGTLGCAAAAGRLLGLGTETIGHALGIALSQAAGSMEFLADGAWTKRLHPGWAALSGITAARLAQAGFTGPSSAIEGKAGFLASHSAAPRPDLAVAGLGEGLEIARTSIKAHACCRYKQAPIDGLLDLVRRHALRDADVESVRIGVLAAGWEIIAEPRARKLAPTSVVDAQFSMPFGAAVALVHGRASIHEYTPAMLADREVRAAMHKVECVRDPELDARFPRQWPAWTEIRTHDGRRLRSVVDHPRGDPENPLSFEEVVAKALDLAGDTLPRDRLDAVVRGVRDLPPGEPVRALTELLRLPRPLA